VVALALVTFAKSDENCRTLALSGGGNKGAWETGIVWGLTHYGNPEDFAYDVMTGVSAGTINSVTLSFYPKGQDIQAAEYLDYRW
jgi:predicted acylesterase/phospholipase RssA